MQMAGFSYHSENEGETDRQRLQVAQMIHENSKKLIMAPWKSVTPKDVDYIHLDGGEKTELLKLCSFLTEAKYEYLRNDLDMPASQWATRTISSSALISPSTNSTTFLAIPSSNRTYSCPH